jgi:hypothetical protein
MSLRSILHFVKRLVKVQNDYNKTHIFQLYYVT